MEKKSEFWYRNIRQLRSLEDLRPEELYGDNLKYALDMLGMSQAELSRMTGIHKVMISRYVNGVYAPDLNNGIKIFHALWKVIADREYGGHM